MVITFQDKILEWALTQHSFTIQAVASVFDKTEQQASSALHELMKSGKIEQINKELVPDRNRKLKVYRLVITDHIERFSDLEHSAVNQFRNAVSEYFEPVVITSRGKVIGVYTPIGDLT